MSYTTISKSTEYFNTVLYSGDDATTRNITGFGFQPDWIWNKARSAAYNNYLIDAVRGSPGKVLMSNLNAAEDSDSGFQNSFKGFVADGHTIGQVSGYEVNDSGVNYVEWGWRAGTTSGLSGGTITPSSYSINTTSGFGIYKYTGTGSAGTIAHGLGKVPKMIIVKPTSTTGSWVCYHVKIGNDKGIVLNSDAAEYSNTNWNTTTPTNSLFSLRGGGDVNTNGVTYIAYVFAEIPGYSRISSYKGQAGAGGQYPFIYTGFKPTFLLMKPSNATGNWFIFDSKREGYNVLNDYLLPNQNIAEVTNHRFDLTSNGFKLRTSNAGWNGSGTNYIYMAFGQSVVGSNNIPVTAR